MRVKPKKFNNRKVLLKEKKFKTKKGALSPLLLPTRGF